MGMPDSEKLAIAEIAFYGPALPLAAFIAFRHGFGRQQGWLYIVLLAICRILGASCSIAAQHDPTNSTLFTIASICGSIGISFLAQVLIGILKRVQDGIEPGKGIPPRYLNILSLPLLVGIILGIVGGTDQSSTNPSTVTSGQNYFKAAIILFAFVIFILGGALILTAIKLNYIARGERTLVYALLAAYPFLVVRLVYALIAISNPSSTTFNIFHPDIIVQALMTTLEEFIIVIIIISAGFITPTIDRAAAQRFNFGAGAGPGAVNAGNEWPAVTESATYPMPNIAHAPQQYGVQPAASPQYTGQHYNAV